MKISVIVPVYNCEKYINDCIQSLINQTYSNVEIIIIDDGSNDNSLNIINKYKSNNNVKIFSQKNSGANKARKCGIENATGEYIMFVDGDDWIDSNCIDYLVKMINKYNADIIRFNCILEPSKKEKIFYKTKNNCPELLKKENIYDLFISTSILNNLCFNIYKKELFSNIPAFNSDFSNAEDLWANLELFTRSKNVLMIDKILYHYRINNNSTTKIKKYSIIKKNVTELIYVLNQFWKYLDKWNISNNKEYRTKLAIKYIDTVRMTITSIYDCNDCLFKEKNNFIKEVFNSDNFEYIRNNFEYKDIKNVLLNTVNIKNIYKMLGIKYVYKKKYKKLYFLYVMRKIFGR